MKQAKPFFKTLYEYEFERKKHVILETIAKEALEGHIYLPVPFSRYFEDYRELGSSTTIQRYLKLYSEKGWIQYNLNSNGVNLSKPLTSTGFMCVRGMRYKGNKQRRNASGRMEYVAEPFYPTHFRDSKTGLLCQVKNPRIWEEE